MLKSRNRNIIAKIILSLLLCTFLFSLVSCEKNENMLSSIKYAGAGRSDVIGNRVTEADCQDETQADKETNTVPESPAPGITYEPIVLMYHLVLEEPYSKYTDLFVRPSDFEGHICDLIENGYQFMFADEYHTTDVPSVIITFDDGYTDNYTEVFPILQKYNAKATIFMISDAIDHDGYLTSGQIKEMAASGLVRFGSHTATHVEVDSLSEERMREEFELSKQTIAQVSAQERVDAFCYPAGHYSDEAIEVVKEYFTAAYTTQSPGSVGEHSEFEIPRYRIRRDLGSRVTVLFPDD